MIYQIPTTQVSIALTNNCKLLIISGDSSNALVQGDNLSNLTIINEYNDNDLYTVISDIFWRQPCKDC